MIIPERVKIKLKNFIYDTDECINYPHLNSDGYGIIQPIENGKKLHILIHRAIYQIFFNDNIDSTDIICHKCDNPACCNPKHLFKGTYNDNVQDKVNKGRQAKGEQNGRYIDGRASDHKIKKIHTHGAKLTKEQVLKIRELIKTGISLKEISIQLDISYSTIKDIHCNRAYKNIL